LAIAIGFISSFITWLVDGAKGSLDFKTTISTTWGDIKTATSTKWGEIKASLSQTWDDLKTSVSTKFGEMKTSIGEWWSKTKDDTSTKWDDIKKTLSDKWKVISTNSSTTWDNVKKYISDKWSEINASAPGTWDSIKTTLKTKWDEISTTSQGVWNGIVDFIKTTFSGDWSTAWQNIVDTFGKIWDKLKELAKSPVNAVIGYINGMIDGVNAAIKALNNIKVKIPDWVPGDLGGKSFSLNLSTVGHIPALATGGVIDTPTLAQIGENGREVVMPLEKNTGWIDTLATQIASKIGGDNSNSNTSSDSGDLILMIDGDVIGKIAISQIRKAQRQGNINVIPT
jgi:hypothetical protein